MTKITWFLFRDFKPNNGSTIIVKDHEGNLAVGIWDDGFVNACKIPLGHLVKWSKAKVIVYKINDHYDCEVFYENGTKVQIEELYDEEKLFPEMIEEKRNENY